MNNIEFVDYLIGLILKNEANDNLSEFASFFNQVGSCGRTPLMVASSVGNTRLVDLFLKEGANPNAVGYKLMTALHEASSNGRLEVAKLLINAEAKIDAVSEDGVTPLMCAAAWGYKNLVDLLLKKGANKFLKDSYGASAIDIAYEKEEDELADFIINFKQ